MLEWLLGLERVAGIDSVEPRLSAAWAMSGSGPFWIFLGLVTICTVVFLFYWKFQHRGTLASRLALAATRAAILALLFVTVAEPVLVITAVRRHQPVVYLLIDGTESMTIADPGDSAARDETRIERIRAWLGRNDNPLAGWEREAGCRIEAMTFDGANSSRVRRLDSSRDAGGRIDAGQLAAQLSTNGQVTAVGRALSDLQQLRSANLSAVLMFSDFSQNAGVSPIGTADGLNAPARDLGVPIHTLGLGRVETRDLAIDVQTDPKVRRTERSTVRVKLESPGLAGQTTEILVRLRPRSGDAGSAVQQDIPIASRSVVLTGETQWIEFPFEPEHAGEADVLATASPLPGEAVEENNHAARRVNIIDDYIRLMFVEFEPTWEWRFVKEVFHRDQTVGLRGFRTYLSSSDPRVRETNELFLTTLAPSRSEFFESDVVFLGDLPAETLTPRLCSLIQEFVRDLGGGLVVISGPRFGPQALAGTPLADMLPVVIDPDAGMRDQQPFRPRLTPQASLYPFMRLADDESENERAWARFDRVPWYQPVAQRHERAEVLIEHPTDVCRDGQTPQPLMAIRRYGEGEVVYLAVNEMWRLRRKQGEHYYRQFWSPLIDRLGLSHALGARKRFVPRLDRRQYRVDDTVTFTVHAYDRNYEPLGAGGEPAQLEAELLIPASGGAGTTIRKLAMPMLRAGVFESRIPVFVGGTYRLRVTDPVTDEVAERQFDVTAVSAERRRAVRDESLQREIARQSGGLTGTFSQIDEVLSAVKPEPIQETTVEHHALWNTPLWFLLIVGLMIGEWSARRMVRLK